MQATRFLIISVCFFLITFHSNAQEKFADIERFEEARFKIFYKRLTVKPESDKAYGGGTINFAWATNDAKKWGSRLRWESTAFSDAIAGVVKKHIRKKKITESGLDHAFSSGFLGSFQYYLNVSSKDKLIISAGFSLGDYIVAIDRFTETNNLPVDYHSGRAFFDPAGYFFVAGPSIMVSKLPSKVSWFWIDVFAYYDIAFHKIKNTGLLNYVPEEGYALPHFLTIGVDIHTKSILYGGIKFNTILDYGNNKANISRMDLSVGVYLF